MEYYWVSNNISIHQHQLELLTDLISAHLLVTVALPLWQFEPERVGGERKAPQPVLEWCRYAPCAAHRARRKRSISRTERKMLIAEQQRMKSLVGEMSGLLVSDLRMCTSSGLSL